jgi:PAS domain S-box-containing protein
MPARELLKEKDKKFRLLFEDHPQPMCVFDDESQVVLDANTAAAQLYGYSRDELRGKHLSNLDAEIDLSTAETIPSRSRVPVTVWRHRTANGSVIELEVAVHDIDFAGRRARLAVLLDITGRRHLEEQLRQAQKMEAVGMLAGGVAHDFNNLLTIITGYSQLILNNLAPNDQNRHSVEQIMKAGERAAALTKQLLAFSRRQVLQPRVVDLNKLVTSISNMLQRLIGEDIDLRLVLPPDLGRVNADPGQIEQVVMNLVVNARDAMPKGGVLTLETGNVSLDPSYAHAHIAVRPGSYVMIAVSDTGSGMDEPTKARLFEPFFTTKGAGKGTGLGLSTVFGIVKQSGGSVEVYSEPGRGTSVKVYLPRIDQPVSLETQVARRKIGRGSETVLLVEDDEMVRTLVRETLERDGYRVLDAPGPIEARRISDLCKEPIQLLITDVIMPKVSGRELAQQLVERRPCMKVLYMSGYTDNAIVNSGILKKEVAFIQKPFTPQALAEKVREVLENDGSRTRKAGE